MQGTCGYSEKYCGAPCISGLCWPEAEWTVRPEAAPAAGLQPSPPQAPRVNPFNATCRAIQQDVDFWGADLSNGTVRGLPSANACCNACKARPGCGAYTYVPRDGACYLKNATGWELRAAPGLQSALVQRWNEPRNTLPRPPAPDTSSPPAEPKAVAPSYWIKEIDGALRAAPRLLQPGRCASRQPLAGMLHLTSGTWRLPQPAPRHTAMNAQTLSSTPAATSRPLLQAATL